MSLLVDGFIPKGTVYPYLSKCGDDCLANHQGTNHKVDFSCGLARAYDIRISSRNKNVSK